MIEVKQSATPLRDLSDRIRQQKKVGAVLLGARVDGRVQLVLNIDKGLVERGLDAAQVIREIAGLVSGGGGGRADFAEAGGREPEKLGDALDAGPGAARRRAFVKVLALDYGSARTGVAVSDPTGTIARPLGVVEKAGTDAGRERLRALIADEEPGPRRRRAAAHAPGRARRAGARRRSASPGRCTDELDCPVELFDERFTSVLADGDDARAAAHLLSSYLEWSRER